MLLNLDCSLNPGSYAELPTSSVTADQTVHVAKWQRMSDDGELTLLRTLT